MSADIPVEPSGGPARSGRLIVRHCGNAHRHMCRYLVDQHGFEDLCRLLVDPGSKKKLVHFRDMVGDMVFALRRLPRLRRASEIVSTGPMAAAVACLLKMGLLPNCRHVWWLGLFIHSPRWLRRLRLFFRLVDSRRLHYLLFSEFEKALYVHALGLELTRLHHLPYGDMSPRQSVPDEKITRQLAAAGEPYFFSGGATSRDYPALIEVFRELPHKLVIICSRLNTDVPASGLPSNITVLRAVPFSTFEAYASAAEACIVPIAWNTGAAGQSVLLSHMQQRKIIIATDTGIIREYLQDGVSGILVGDNLGALAAAVRKVAANPRDYKHFGDAAQARFQQCFSRLAIERRLDELVREQMTSEDATPPDAN